MDPGWGAAAAGAGTAGGSAWPPFCCIIITDGAGSVLAEKRSAANKVAPSKLTCFGGKREKGEPPAHCLARECREELGWEPPRSVTDSHPAVALQVNGHLIAWFYACRVARGETLFTFEEARGHTGVWTASDDPLFSPWHARVLQAHARGDTVARFDDGDEQATLHLLAALPTA